MLEQIERLVGEYERGRLSRRQLLAGIVAAAGTEAAGSGQGRAVEVAGIDHVAFRVSDVRRSRQFYQRVLNARVRSQTAGSAFLTVGDDWIALFGEGSRTTGEEAVAGGVDHVSFRLASHQGLQARLELIQELGLDPIHPRGTSRTYFRDPDGNMIQFS